ncbi:MAG: hypothetical protein WC457_00100 [Patescibacteria group bacterium]
MKNATMTFAVLFVMAFAGAATALSPEDFKPVVLEKEAPVHQAERALFATPCPGQTDLWCVAIKNEGPVGSVLGYEFEKRSDGTYQFVDRANMKTEAIKAIFPKDLIKNWDITPSEAIIAAYNGKMTASKTSLTMNWFMLNQKTTELKADIQRSRATMVFTEKVNTTSDFSLIISIAVLAAIIIGIWYGSFGKLFTVILYSLSTVAVVIASRMIVLSPPFAWDDVDFIVMFIMSTPLVAMITWGVCKYSDKQIAILRTKLSKLSPPASGQAHS